MANTNSLHYRLPIKSSGYTKLVSPANSALATISLDMLCMNPGESRTFSPESFEKVIVILSGTCSAFFRHHEEIGIGERENVFDGPASAIYIPAGHEATLTSQAYLEVAVLKAPSDRVDLQPRVVRPSDVRRKVVGRGNWLRHVYDIVDGGFPADRLIVGETINPPGNWSSSPPHKHDRHNPPHESRFEEVYMYKLNPIQGFGLQRVYTAEGDLDECYAVQDNDIVVLPCGYHPVVACPGYRLYYLWVLAGQDRDPVWFDDPAHSWIHELNHELKNDE